MDPGWAYVAMIDRLTNGDITKDEEVFKINYVHCLVRMLYWKDKDDFIEKMNMIEEAKAKQKR